MPSDARQKMIESAVTLLALRGLEGTAFSDVLERSGAPRGSIYHHFPDGKDQLVEAAIGLAGERALGVSTAAWVATQGGDGGVLRPLAGRAASGRTSGQAARCSRSRWRRTRPDLLDQAASIFRAWRGRIAELFVEGGMASDAATRLAATLVAASEGAVVVSRAERSLEPFELVAAELLAHYDPWRTRLAGVRSPHDADLAMP